jgi:hypothetical protein
MKGKDNSLRWLAEPLAEMNGFIEKPMFGALAYYLRGMMVLVLSDREEPWDGLLLPTERDNHHALINDFPALIPHPVLGKWLFLSVKNEEFESTASDIVSAIEEGDPRIGVEPKPKKKKRASVKKRRKTPNI